MFSPWLVPYYPQNMKKLPANWIRQILTQSNVLVPWNETHSTKAQQMLCALIDCVQFLLDTLPASDSILASIFYWYEQNFGNALVPRHVLVSLHAGLTLLPWNRLNPAPLHIDFIYRILQQVNFYLNN